MTLRQQRTALGHRQGQWGDLVMVFGKGKMMKSPLLALALGSVAALSAMPTFAADLPYRKGPPIYTPAPMPPVFTWTGFYVGVNAGAGFGNSRSSYDPFVGGAPTGFGNGRNNVGFTGGGQIGYNWQISQFVLGLEADINYLDRGSSSTSSPAAAAPYYTISTTHGDDYFGTVRGRVGFAFDRFLVYGTGGFAYGGNIGSSTITYFPGGGTNYTYNQSNNGSKTGYTVGGGIEYAFTPNWSAKVEYLYNDFGRRSGYYYSTQPAAPGFFYGRRDNNFSVVRVGLNYKFW